MTRGVPRALRSRLGLGSANLAQKVLDEEVDDGLREQQEELDQQQRVVRGHREQRADANREEDHEVPFAGEAEEENRQHLRACTCTTRAMATGPAGLAGQRA